MTNDHGIDFAFFTRRRRPDGTEYLDAPLPSGARLILVKTDRARGGAAAIPRAASVR